MSLIEGIFGKVESREINENDVLDTLRQLSNDTIVSVNYDHWEEQLQGVQKCDPKEALNIVKEIRSYNPFTGGTKYTGTIRTKTTSKRKDVTIEERANRVEGSFMGKPVLGNSQYNLTLKYTL